MIFPCFSMDFYGVSMIFHGFLMIFNKPTVDGF